MQNTKNLDEIARGRLQKRILTKIKPWTQKNVKFNSIDEDFDCSADLEGLLDCNELNTSSQINIKSSQKNHRRKAARNATSDCPYLCCLKH